MGDALVLRGELKGHSNWVTSIAVSDAAPVRSAAAARARLHDAPCAGKARLTTSPVPPHRPSPNRRTWW